MAHSVRAIELVRLLPRGRTLAAYGDAGGEAHRVKLCGHLVLDLCRVRGTAVVVAELAADEGEAEAQAILQDGGYLEKAKAETVPLGRSIVSADVAPRVAEPAVPPDGLRWGDLGKAA